MIYIAASTPIQSTGTYDVSAPAFHQPPLRDVNDVSQLTPTKAFSKILRWEGKSKPYEHQPLEIKHLFSDHLCDKTHTVFHLLSFYTNATNDHTTPIPPTTILQYTSHGQYTSTTPSL